MLDFKKHFPGAALYELNENYRSAKEIVNAACAVIKENKHRLDKTPVSRSTYEGSVGLREFKDPKEELQTIIREIKTDKEGCGGCCILLRNNRDCERYASSLSGEGIPFICRERLGNIYEAEAAKDIISYLKIAAGSTERADMYRIMNRPVRFISRDSIKGKNFDLDSMKAYHRYEPETVKRIEELKADIRCISGMRPFGAIHYILHKTGYLKYYRSVNKNAKEAERLFDELLSRSEGYAGHRAFLDAIEEYSNSLMSMYKGSGRGDEASGRADAVSVMTYHASKGLEFKRVYLPSVNEGIIPGGMSVKTEEIEEERRLFYVGMTRAGEELMISWYKEDDMGRREPSRFLMPLNPWGRG